MEYAMSLIFLNFVYTNSIFMRQIHIQPETIIYYNIPPPPPSPLGVFVIATHQ